MNIGEIQVNSEMEILQKVLVCRPSYMRIADVINETQKKHATSNIDKSIACRQHDAFIERLKTYGVQVKNLETDENLPEQVFTRDIGFVVGNTLFVSSMACDIRKRENNVLKQWLMDNDMLFEIIESGTIEGGDVLVDGNKVLVGISSRTTWDAFYELKKKLPNYTCHPFVIREDVLHLDCVLSLYGKKEALWLPGAFLPKDREWLEKTYACESITEEEHARMGANILQVKNDIIFSMPEQKRINHILRQKGYIVEELDFSEIIKSGGSFRCCSLPLYRL